MNVLPNEANTRTGLCARRGAICVPDALGPIVDASHAAAAAIVTATDMAPHCKHRNSIVALQWQPVPFADPPILRNYIVSLSSATSAMRPSPTPTCRGLVQGVMQPYHSESRMVRLSVGVDQLINTFHETADCSCAGLVRSLAGLFRVVP